MSPSVTVAFEGDFSSWCSVVNLLSVTRGPGSFTTQLTPIRFASTPIGCSRGTSTARCCPLPLWISRAGLLHQGWQRQSAELRPSQWRHVDWRRWHHPAASSAGRDHSAGAGRADWQSTPPRRAVSQAGSAAAQYLGRRVAGPLLTRRISPPWQPLQSAN